MAQLEPPISDVDSLGRVKSPQQTQGFAAATAEATGQSKATTNRAIARAEALGDEALAKVVNTSLDSGVELDFFWLVYFRDCYENPKPWLCWRWIWYETMYRSL